MTDWADLVVASLRELGADHEMVPGAMLRQRMEVIGAKSGLDVGAHLADASEPFVQSVSKVHDVVITRRPGSDVLVGLTGASTPQNSPRPEQHGRPGTLRKDVFQAFTRIAAIPFVYMPDSDVFAPQDRSSGPTIEVNKVSLDDLIADRMAFVNSLAEEAQPPLRAALERSPNPLATFREQATAQGLLGQWASRQAEMVKARVLSWAQECDITPRRDWFQQRLEITAHQALERLLPYLTPDEIRAMSVPFRAVEAFLLDDNR